MKKINRQTQRILLIAACVLIIIVAAVLLVRGIRSFTASRTDTSEGVEYIEKAESADITAVEEKISRLEQQESPDGSQRSMKERFSNAVVLGDSIAEGFLKYDILNASSVIAQADAPLGEAAGLIERAGKMSPQIIFLSLGGQDLEETQGDAESFTERYGQFLDTLQEEIPNAHIYVNAILPVDENVLEEKPDFERLEEYNTALEALCDSRRVGFIDNTDLVETQYYEEDGIHFRAEFYTLWGQHMAEVAGL